MARIQLENRLSVTLQRLLFTGRSYTVEPPAIIPPNALVFWQAEDSGAVSYSALPPGGLVAAPAATFPPATGRRPAAPPTAGAGGPQSNGAQPSVPPITAPVAVATYPPAVTNPSMPMATSASTRRLTLAWDFSTSGRRRYFTQQVGASLRVRVLERPDGAAYTVSARGRAKRAPFGPPRPHRLGIALSLMAALLIVSTVSVSALAIRVGPSHLPILGVLFNHTTKPPHSTAPTATLLLTASKSEEAAGVPVVLTATVIGTINNPSSYGIDIVNSISATPLTRTPCEPVAEPCKVEAVSSAPGDLTFQAYVERGYHKGVQVTSSAVTVTWLPRVLSNYTINLTALPAADSTGTVNVKPGTPVTLTATTNRTVDNTGYQIDIVDGGHNTSVRTGKPCEKGKTCTTTVRNDSNSTVTYVAYFESTAQTNVRLPSNKIKVVWSSSAPPPPPPSVYLKSKPAPDSTRTVHLTVGDSVLLTVTATSGLDGSGYQIAIVDSGFNPVYGPCARGTSCNTSIAKSSPATITYVGVVEKSSSGHIIYSDTPITVAWSLPQPPTKITLAADHTFVPNTATVTLTATTDRSVTGTGYEIQIVASNGYVETTCNTGTSCPLQAAPGYSAQFTYTAYVDQGFPNGVLRTSSPVMVTWDAVYLQVSTTTPPSGTPISFAATSDMAVTGTGYEIEVYDVTSNFTLLGRCASGSSCPSPPGTIYNPLPCNSSSPANYTYQAFVDQGDPAGAVVASGQVVVTWQPYSCLNIQTFHRGGALAQTSPIPLVAWRELDGRR